MAYKEVSRVDIMEVIRRWQAGSSQRHIALGTGLSRETVGRYIAAAERLGVSYEGPAPTDLQLDRLAAIGRSGPRAVATPAEDKLVPWADQIYQWLTVDRLQLTRILELLGEQGCRVSYTSLRRFIQRRNWQSRSRTTVRMETEWRRVRWRSWTSGAWATSEDAETGRRRTVWALIVVLAYSSTVSCGPPSTRSWKTSSMGWRRLGRSSVAFPLSRHRQLPAAVAGADALHPRLTRGFLEYSQHRGFICDPARARHPKDKPKVERGVQYVRERFFKGGSFSSFSHLREEAARWCRDVAGRRVHGTTRRQPLAVFQDEERQALAPWDGEPYEITHWRTVKVHPDHHVAASMPSTRCQRRCVRRDSRWRSGWAANWCASTTGEG